MTNVEVSSIGNDNMIEVPWFMQNPTAAGIDLTYSANAVRYLMRGYRATAPSGVGSGLDFVTTPGGGYSVAVSGGIGVTNHSTNPQERYSFGSFGSVTIPLTGLARGTGIAPNYHHLQAEVRDAQLGYAGATRWRYVVVESTGGVFHSTLDNAISLAKIKDTGQTNIASGDITDTRVPFDNTAPTCSLVQTSESGWNNTNRAWNWVQLDDPYNLFSSADPTKIYIRHPGTYDLCLAVQFPGLSGNSYLDIGITDSIGGIGMSLPLARAAVINGTTLTAITLGRKIIPATGYYIQCYANTNFPSPGAMSAQFSLHRSEYRSS